MANKDISFLANLLSKNQRTFVVALLILFSFLSTSQGSQKGDNNHINAITKDQVREIVIDVIKKNPKLLYEVISKYIREQQEKKQIANAFRNRILGIPISSYNPIIGPKDAPITIIEFTDFQCPFCKRASQTMDELMDLYPDKIRLVFRNLPLSSIHKESMNAAKAAMAANRQGMFWPYHDMLFDSSPNLNRRLYIKIAQDLELDINRFKKDMKSDDINKQLQNDIKTAKKFGINVTPVFVINGVLVKGARPIEFFKKIIEKLLTETK